MYLRNNKEQHVIITGNDILLHFVNFLSHHINDFTAALIEANFENHN
ncbi:hypothetical protein [Thermococcus sp.]